MMRIPALSRTIGSLVRAVLDEHATRARRAARLEMMRAAPPPRWLVMSDPCRRTRAPASRVAPSPRAQPRDPPWNGGLVLVVVDTEPPAKSRRLRDHEVEMIERHEDREPDGEHGGTGDQRLAGECRRNAGDHRIAHVLVRTDCHQAPSR